MFRKLTLYLLTLLAACLFIIRGDAFSSVVREEGKTFIVDRNGYRWEVTQAESMGFKPEGFQFGIGKNAFTPLDDKDLSSDTSGISSSHRILGVEKHGEARAYSIPKLSRHEVANSEIGKEPIAAAY